MLRALGNAVDDAVAARGTAQDRPSEVDRDQGGPVRARCTRRELHRRRRARGTDRLKPAAAQGN